MGSALQGLSWTFPVTEIGTLLRGHYTLLSVVIYFVCGIFMAEAILKIVVRLIKRAGGGGFGGGGGGFGGGGGGGFGGGGGGMGGVRMGGGPFGGVISSQINEFAKIIGPLSSRAGEALGEEAWREYQKIRTTNAVDRQLEQTRDEWGDDTLDEYETVPLDEFMRQNKIDGYDEGDTEDDDEDDGYDEGDTEDDDEYDGPRRPAWPTTSMWEY